MRTQQEILDRYKSRKDDDLLGFEVNEYLSQLDWDHAKEFLRSNITEEKWVDLKLQFKDSDEIKNAMINYLSFAWEKANNRRGISAGRSLMHYIAWFWLAEEDEFSNQIDDDIENNYCYYGKPTLVKISEKLGVDWRDFDDNLWVNKEDEQGIPADQALNMS